MSSTPKGPNPEDDAGPQASAAPGPALDQTFLGVAPAKPAPTPAAAPSTAAPPPVAAPPIARPAGAAARMTAPAPAAALGSEASAPARGSAIIAAPMISVQGSRASATTSPRPSRAGESGAAPGAPEPAPPVQPDARGQSTSRITRAANPEETPSHGTPRELVSPAAASPPLQPQRTLAPGGPASPAGFSVEARAPLTPQVPPRMELGQQRTALASEYLRAAREAALAVNPVPPAHESGAAGRGWQETHTRDASHDDFGTQASVAPPFPDHDRDARARAVQPSFALAPPSPLPAPPPIGSMAASLPMPMPALGQHRPGPPAFGRTLLDSPGGAAHEDRPSSPPFGRPSSPPGVPGQFEHVPMPRGSLSDQSALQIPIDQSSAGWDQLGLGHDSTEKLSGHVKSSARRRLLLLSALATLAVAAIGFVTFGDRLMGSSQRQQALLPRPAAPASLPLQAPPSVDTTASRPNGLPSTREPLVAARSATAGRELTAAASAKHSARSEADAPEDEAAAAASARAAEALASPEDKLAAEAARQVIASRYPEALPIYRELARKFPQNTAYAAMAHILEQKIAAAAAPNGAKDNMPGATR
ncbi:MAG TPA: hypothetical protein VG963_29020 [Polyangiaceae bacterium]|nr:hypothetical protein [Polyangiaceae bacterium]